MIVLGLTGSIGMGKSTTARMFVEQGVPVHDSDEAVHRLYAGAAAPLVEAAFPGTTRDGVVDRALLAARILGDAEAIRRVEAIVHPLVRADADALRRQRILARPGMTEEKFRAILARQVPDAEKRRQADFIVDRSQGMEAARDQVRAIIDALVDRASSADGS